MISEATWMALIESAPDAVARVDGECRGRILAIARAIVRDESEAEDVLQDVLLTVHLRATTVRSRGQFEPWLKQVSRNASLMLLRRRRRAPTPLSDDVVAALRDAETLEVGGLDPERRLASRRVLERVGVRLAALPPEHRALFVAVDIDGDDRDDVEREFGLSTPALKSRLHRIRASLRDAALAA